MKKIKYFSTFTGVGGFEIGIQTAIPGAECVGMCEIDPHASNVLRYKFKGVKNYGDIRKVNAEELPDFDILCGGFPCQTFSIAGNRMGFKDTRGTLFFELARIAKSKRPKILFFENVKGLLSHEEGRTITTIIKTLDELGYDAEWQVLNSKHFGVPQNRERIVIVGHLRGTSGYKVFPIPRANSNNNEKSKGEKIIHGTITCGLGRQGSSGEYVKSIDTINKARKGLKEITTGASQGQRVYDPEGVSVTLAAQAGGLGAKTGLYKVKQELENSKERWGDHYKTADDQSPTLMAIGKTDVAKIIVPTQIGNSKKFGNASKEKDEAYTLRASEPNGIIVHSLQTRSADRPILKKNPHAGGSGHISKEDETYCLDTGSTQAIEIGTSIRRLTPVECERLQGFPDDWTKYGLTEEGKTVEISDNQRYKMMGNAVTTKVMESVAARIRSALMLQNESS